MPENSVITEKYGTIVITANPAITEKAVTAEISAKDVTTEIIAAQETYEIMTEDRARAAARTVQVRIAPREIVTAQAVRSEVMTVRIVLPDREITAQTGHREIRDVRRAARIVWREEPTEEDLAAARTVREQTAAVSVRTPERMTVKLYLLRN